MPKPQSLWCFIALCGQQSGTRDTRNSGGPVGSLQSQKFSFGVWSKSLLVWERTQHAALYLLFWLPLNQTGFANFGSFHVGLLCLKFTGAENKRGFRMIFGFVGRSITLQTRLWRTRSIKDHSAPRAGYQAKGSWIQELGEHSGVPEQNNEPELVNKFWAMRQSGKSVPTGDPAHRGNELSSGLL